MVNIDINKLTTRKGNINSGIMAAVGPQDRFIVTDLDIEDLIPSEDNFYSLSDIESLKDNIEEFGIQQNLTVMRRPDKKYEIIAGHRRREACRLLVQEGKKKFRWLPCRILPTVSETVKNILLITMNSETRKKTAAEITEEIERLKILYANYKKENPNFKGRVREIIAKDMGMSVATVGRHEEINNNLIPEIKDAYKDNKVNFTAAVEFSKLSAADQKAVYEKTGGKVTSKEIKKRQPEPEIEKNLKGDNYCSDPIQYKVGDQPFDLTNMTLKCQVRKSVDSGVIGELTPVVEDAKNCWLHLEATAAIMATFPTTGYTPIQTVPFYYDVQAYGPGDYTKTLIYGTLPIRPEVTK